MKWKIAAAVVVLVLVGIGATEFSRASKIDACVQSALQNARERNESALAEMIDNPSIRDSFLNAETMDVAFTRPVSSEWARAGIVVKTSTRAQLIVLLIDTEKLPKCRMLRDYEGGAFTGRE